MRQNQKGALTGCPPGYGATWQSHNFEVRQLIVNLSFIFP